MKFNKNRLLQTFFAILLLISGITDFSSFAKIKKKSDTQSAKKHANVAKSSKNKPVAFHYLLNNGDSAVWVRSAKNGLIVYKDSTGQVSGMVKASVNKKAAYRYAQMINRLAQELEDDNVRVYACPVPSMGDFYMPEVVGGRGNERENIRLAAEALIPEATMVFIGDTLAQHTDLQIFNRTDHHWSPLGGFYGAKALATAAGVKFRDLSEYSIVRVPDYVGTMAMYTGDPEIKKNPEDFIYFLPPEGYKSEFITYNVSNGHTIGEKGPVEAPFFKHASGAGLYCTFMGGDAFTVKTYNTGGTPGRRLLIVKDSYGNAMPSNLFGSFEEVHVIDFRYFPHNLLDYVRDNKITDLAVVNTLSLAFSQKWQDRFNTMLTIGKSKSVSDPNVVNTVEDQEELDQTISAPWAK